MLGIENIRNTTWKKYEEVPKGEFRALNTLINVKQNKKKKERKWSILLICEIGKKEVE